MFSVCSCFTGRAGGRSRSRGPAPGPDEEVPLASHLASAPVAMPAQPRPVLAEAECSCDAQLPPSPTEREPLSLGVRGVPAVVGPAEGPGAQEVPEEQAIEPDVVIKPQPPPAAAVAKLSGPAPRAAVPSPVHACTTELQAPTAAAATSPALHEHALHEAPLHPDAHGEGGLACTNDKLLKEQREAISQWIASMGKKIFTGNFNLVSTPFPVIMFEPRSYLEKLADVWVYPRFLRQASACEHDPLERMKLVVTWFIAGLHHGFEKWKKPFNPILGETWQASLSDGSEMFMEQISHHPPVTAFNLLGPGGSFRFTGLSQPNVSIVLKHYGVRTVAHGFRFLEFGDGTRIEMAYPGYNIKGIVYSSRPRAEVDGVAVFTDRKHRLRAEVRFGANKGALAPVLRRSDAIIGEIYQLPPEQASPFQPEASAPLPLPPPSSSSHATTRQHPANSRQPSGSAAGLHTALSPSASLLLASPGGRALRSHGEGSDSEGGDDEGFETASESDFELRALRLAAELQRSGAGGDPCDSPHTATLDGSAGGAPSRDGVAAGGGKVEGSGMDGQAHAMVSRLRSLADMVALAGANPSASAHSAASGAQATATTLAPREQPQHHGQHEDQLQLGPEAPSQDQACKAQERPAPEPPAPSLELDSVSTDSATPPNELSPEATSSSSGGSAPLDSTEAASSSSLGSPGRRSAAMVVTVTALSATPPPLDAPKAGGLRGTVDAVAAAPEAVSKRGDAAAVGQVEEEVDAAAARLPPRSMDGCMMPRHVLVPLRTAISGASTTATPTAEAAAAEAATSTAGLPAAAATATSGGSMGMAALVTRGSLPSSPQQQQQGPKQPPRDVAPKLGSPQMARSASARAPCETSASAAPGSRLFAGLSGLSRMMSMGRSAGSGSSSSVAGAGSAGSAGAGGGAAAGPHNEAFAAGGGGQVVARMEGSWLSHLNIDGRRYWTLATERSDMWRALPDALPSDSRFRRDLVCIQRGDIKQAQEWKERLEEAQRRDKRLREAGRPTNSSYAHH